MQQLPKIDLSKDRLKWEKLADLYALIVQVEHLEIVWARGSCKDDEYTDECEGLIRRFKAAKAGVAAYVHDISTFFKEYAPDCHAARNRLLVVGVPATTYHGGSSAKVKGAKDMQLTVAQTVQYFITTIDGLQLSLKAVDEVIIISYNIHMYTYTLHTVFAICRKHKHVQVGRYTDVM